MWIKLADQSEEEPTPHTISHTLIPVSRLRFIDLDPAAVLAGVHKHGNMGTKFPGSFFQSNILQAVFLNSSL